MTQEPKHPHNRKKRHPNWGGRRLGAGAPGGNMNALKHGRRSARMAKIGMVVAAEPTVRDALLAIADRWERHQMKADEVVNHILAQVLERGLRRGDERLDSYIEDTLGRPVKKKRQNKRPPKRENLD